MCRIISDDARIIAVCDSQQQQQQSSATATTSSSQTTGTSTASQNNKSKYFTVTFRSFTPQPRGLEFKPGQDYYFISTLAGHNGDSDKRFSPCKEHNMKVIFKVCCKPSAASTQPTLSTILSSSIVAANDVTVASVGQQSSLSNLSDNNKRTISNNNKQQPGNADKLTIALTPNGSTNSSASVFSLLMSQQQQQQQTGGQKVLGQSASNNNAAQQQQKDLINLDQQQTNKQNKLWPNEQPHYSISTMPSNQLPNLKYYTGHNAPGEYYCCFEFDQLIELVESDQYT